MTGHPTKSDDAFAEIAAARNGRARRGAPLPDEVHRYYDELTSRVEGLIQSARSVVPGLPPIYFDFVIRPEVNAFAARRGGAFFIGVNTGLVFLLRLLTGRMLSDRGLFPWVGNPKDEDPQVPKIQTYTAHADQMWASEEVVEPRGKMRRAYANHLTDRALMFFVGHEIAHISRGHVGYLEHEKGVSEYFEHIGSEEGGALLQRQCFEFDADRRSVMTSINSLRDTQAEPGWLGLPWGKGPRDTGALFRDWSAAILLVFRLLGDRQLGDINLGKSYPPLLTRLQSADGLAHYGIDCFWPPEEREAARLGIREGRHEVARGFAEVIEISQADHTPEMPSIQHLTMLQSYWNDNLLERVRAYAYEF